MRQIPDLEPVQDHDAIESDHEEDHKKRNPFSSLFKRQKFVEELLAPVEDCNKLQPLYSNPNIDQRRIRTKVYKKPERDFAHLRHVQKLDMPLSRDLNGPSSQAAVWTTAISPDGIYLAAAGSSRIVWVWTILYHHEGEAKNGQVFANKPVRMFQGHSQDIQQLSWSSNNFLVTASLDHTVKLWHVERDECLYSFDHPDIVNSVQFHPTDDRFFASGCFDGKLRVWSIADREVAYEYEAPSPVSAVAFGPKGGMVFCGCFNGLILILSTSGLKLRKKLQVGSQHVLNSDTLRVTGITIFVDEEEAVSRVKMLVSSNGSRLRIYDLQTLDLDCKYRGFTSQYSNSSASLSPDKQWVMAPSEDRRTYIWPRNDTNTSLLTNSTKNSAYESFKSNKGVVTCAMFAPQKTKELMGYSGDIIICSDTDGEVRVYHNINSQSQPTGGGPPEVIFGRHGLFKNISVSKRSSTQTDSSE